MSLDTIKCERCGANKAFAGYSQVGSPAIHLCKSCLRSVSVKGGSLNSFDFPRFFLELASPQSLISDENVSSLPPDLRCPFCGMTIGELNEIGAPGCPACYETFREILESALRKMQR
jgi:protein arginine kinase activator